METHKRISDVYTLVMLSVTFLLLSSEALGQVRKMSTKELSQESTAILMGTCIEKEPW